MKGQSDNSLLFLFGGLALVGIAMYVGKSNTQYTPIPPNTSYNGWHNNTGGNVWINSLGQIIDAAGNLYGTITGLLNQQNQNNGGNGNLSDNQLNDSSQ